MRAEGSLGVDSLNQLQRRRSRGPVEPLAIDEPGVHKFPLRRQIFERPPDLRVACVMLEKLRACR